MTQEQQDATIGRIVRERKEFAQKIGMFTAKAAKQGETLLKLGKILTARPELLAFNGQSSGANSMAEAQWLDVAFYPQLKDIVDTSNEIREIMEHQRRLEEQAGRLGI
jgi:hypothetical protein